jgi:hypothetical protein
MSNPHENTNRQSDPDDLELELELEMVKDLDVSDAEAEQLRGGHSTISTAPAAIGTKSTLG